MHVLALLASFAFLPQTVIAAQNVGPPRVVALVVGISKYDDTRMEFMEQNASRMLGKLKATFPGLDPWYLPNADSTTIRDVLDVNFRKIPEDSFLIIYFAGHGVRRPGAQGSQHEDFYLLTRGAKLTNYSTSTSVKLQEFIDAIDSAGRVKVMLLVDACFSGSDAALSLNINYERWQKIGKRAFMLASSASSEQSIAGHFTEALLEAWDASTSEKCQTPAEFGRTLEQLVYKRSTGFMRANLAFGDDIKMCLSDFSKPSSVLVFSFTPPPKYPCFFFFGADMQSFVPANRVFDRLVPKRDVLVRVECEHQEVYNHVFTAAELVKDVFPVPPIKLPPFLAEDKTAATYDAEVTLRKAQAIETYGANASDYYLAAAKGFAANDPAFDTKPLLKKALGRPSNKPGPFESVVREVAFASNDMIEKLLQKKSEKEIEEIAATSWQLNLFAPYANANESLIYLKHGPSDSLLFGYAAAVGFAAAGDKDGVARMDVALRAAPLSKEQLQTLEFLKKANALEVKASLPVLPSAYVWAADGT